MRRQDKALTVAIQATLHTATYDIAVRKNPPGVAVVQRMSVIDIWVSDPHTTAGPQTPQPYYQRPQL